MRVALRALRARGARLWLPLTAGLDSRTMLAVLTDSKAAFIAYTQERPGMPACDAEIPVGLARSLEIPYITFKKKRAVVSNVKDIYDHVDGSSNDAEQFGFKHGQFDFVTEEHDTILISNCWEIGRLFYHNTLQPATLADLTNPENVPKIFAGLRIFNHRDVIFRQFANWAALYEGVDLQEFSDWRDVFYRDQKLCGWRSLCDQFYDALPGQMIQLANSQIIFDTLLALPASDRLNGSLQRLLIEKCCPDSLNWPINPRGNVMDRVRVRTRTIWRVAQDMENWAREITGRVSNPGGRVSLELPR